MVRVNVQVLLLPALSVAVQVTVVCPSGNVDPLEGSHRIVALAQLSVAVALKVTLLFEHLPASARAVKLVGHVGRGTSRSPMVTVKVQLLLLPAPSRTEHMTGVGPSGKGEPLGGAQTTGASELGQLSVAVTEKVTLLREH
jgi:hypothetical protein